MTNLMSYEYYPGPAVNNLNLHTGFTTTITGTITPGADTIDISYDGDNLLVLDNTKLESKILIKLD